MTTKSILSGLVPLVVIIAVYSTETYATFAREFDAKYFTVVTSDDLFYLAFALSTVFVFIVTAFSGNVSRAVRHVTINLEKICLGLVFIAIAVMVIVDFSHTVHSADSALPPGETYVLMDDYERLDRYGTSLDAYVFVKVAVAEHIGMTEKFAGLFAVLIMTYQAFVLPFGITEIVAYVIDI